MIIKERKMVLFVSIISDQHYFCMIKYIRNQFNTKVVPAEVTTLPKSTISGVMDNMPCYGIE